MSDVVIHGRQTVIGIACVIENRNADLPQISHTGDVPGLLACSIQSRQQHAGKDCDDGDYHKELYKGESVNSALEI